MFENNSFLITYPSHLHIAEIKNKAENNLQSKCKYDHNYFLEIQNEKTTFKKINECDNRLVW